MSPLIEDSSEEEVDEESFRTKQLFSFAWQIAKGMVITVIFYCFIFYKTCPGVIPIMAHNGRIRLKRVPFLGFLHERVGISLVEVYERMRKSVISSFRFVKRHKRANRKILWL